MSEETALETMGEGTFTPEETTETTVETTPVTETTTTPETTTTEAVVETPVFTPSYKVAVMGKDMEIPERFRSLISDADTEKEVREIFEKAYGLDFVKPKHEATKAELEALRNEYTPIKKDLETLKTMFENQDLDGVFNAFGLTDEMIIKHAMNRIEYHQLPPEKQKAVEQQKAQSQKFYQTQLELNNLKAAQAQNELQATVQELQTTVSAPHIQPLVQSFNARAGQQDAFEKAVIAHAQNHFAMTKQDLTVPQAIDSFIKTFGLAAGQAAPQAAAPASAPAARAATLPKAGSGTVAPVKSKVRSIDDIRKLSQQQN